MNYPSREDGKNEKQGIRHGVQHQFPTGSVSSSRIFSLLAFYFVVISDGVLVEMAEHRKDLERKTKPILDTLRSYQDLPPDKALAALAIEDKKMHMLLLRSITEDVLQSALDTTK
ncbi:hypothetical protein FNV43_RR16425 [Rhamnella rubrinervis]|uniref:Uncharacterized protein n=1 Tax=Rhamnella rubrinervis TaxID=2594499 RepID=A0A8K0GYS5_9ROSA|nr:hypothetical protein FNV43_RR16425 [Rhamnella rubrinervis]